MRAFLPVFVLGLISAASAQTVPVDDVVRIGEFYRLAAQIEDGIWAGWSKVASPLLLITPANEFLRHFPSVPNGFKPTNDGFLTRPRHFPTNLQATFPAFGPPSVIAIGEPSHTASKRAGWFPLPASVPGALVCLVALAFCIHVFVAIDRYSHSVSDTPLRRVPIFRLYLSACGLDCAKQ
jgi:hypothetical protein